MAPPPPGSLSSIVASLTRAQVGGSAATAQVDDDALDRHVAELLLQEARNKDKQWGDKGTKAYYDPDKEKNANLRKPNTRFLSSVIRTVDDHNAALRRAEQAAARARERDERDAADRWRRDRRLAHRADSGDQPSPQRRDPSRERRRRRDEDDEEEERQRRRERRHRRRDDFALSDEDLSRRRSHDTQRGSPGDSERSGRRQADRRNGEEPASPSSPRDRYYDRSDRRERDLPPFERGRSTRSGHSRRRSASRSPSRRARHLSRELDHDRSRSGPSTSHRSRHSRREEEEAGDERPGGVKRGSGRDGEDKGKQRELDQVLTEVEQEVERQRAAGRSGSKRPRSPSAPLPPVPPPALPNAPLPSKMDKYFSPTYDPRLDYTLTDVTDSATGLIADGAFDGWDRMLETVKVRKEDKREREEREKAERRRERERRRAEREERRQRRKRRRRSGSAAGSSRSGASDSDEGEGVVGPRYDPASGLMEVAYARKGKTREWDLGKENPT
ncbi:hypothetical protein JCM8202_005495 [Rhodotorula sphaerocarpa]